MGRLVLRLLINTLALWLTTLILAPHVAVRAFAPAGTLEFIITLVLVALLFGVVNGVIGGVVRVVAFPIYVLTLGLVSFIVNGLLLLLVAWIMSFFGWGLQIDGFWWGVLGALVIAILNWILGTIFRSRKRR